jgi:uncharacterized protein YdhG (YjbR/CyaY superfamily)
MTKVDEYLSQVSPSQKKELERIRAVVQKLIPNAEEVITYGMPGFKYKKKFKNHMSIFPGAGAIEKLNDKLGSYTLSKGTVQFTNDHPIPEALLHEIIMLRVHDIDTKQA